MAELSPEVLEKRTDFLNQLLKDKTINDDTFNEILPIYLSGHETRFSIKMMNEKITLLFLTDETDGLESHAIISQSTKKLSEMNSSDFDEIINNNFHTFIDNNIFTREKITAFLKGEINIVTEESPTLVSTTPKPEETLTNEQILENREAFINSLSPEHFTPKLIADLKRNTDYLGNVNTNFRMIGLPNARLLKQQSMVSISLINQKGETFDMIGIPRQPREKFEEIFEPFIVAGIFTKTQRDEVYNTNGVYEKASKTLTNVASPLSTASKSAAVDDDAVGIPDDVVGIPLNFFIKKFNQKATEKNANISDEIELLSRICEKETEGTKQNQIFITYDAFGKLDYKVEGEERAKLLEKRFFTQYQQQQFSKNTAETETKSVVVYDEIEHCLLPEKYGLLKGLDVGCLAFIKEKQTGNSGVIKNLDSILQNITAKTPSLRKDTGDDINNLLKQISKTNKEELMRIRNEVDRRISAIDAGSCKGRM
ncbi:MAG: hypothetical protein LBT02_03510 [Rickettsiales bacterium]|nr:hypothetical protein [Rickettsiales bacterium]